MRNASLSCNPDFRQWWWFRWRQHRSRR